MLEDGLAIAELVKREERNAKRRAKRGSAPKATADLLQIIKRLEEIGAGFRSLTEAIDTTTPVGRMLTQVLGSFAEFEREMIRERTKLGLARARLEGRVGGNRASLTPKQQAHALTMIDESKNLSLGLPKCSGCIAAPYAGWSLSAACWRERDWVLFDDEATNCFLLWASSSGDYFSSRGRVRGGHTVPRAPLPEPNGRSPE